MIARSHITNNGTKIEVLKLPAKVPKISNRVKIISINNNTDNKIKESSDDDMAVDSKKEEEGDLNCQLFWNVNNENDLEDHLEFDNDGMLSVQSEIDMIDNVI